MHARWSVRIQMSSSCSASSTSEPFSTGDLDTGLIERHHDALFAPVKKPFREALALACAALLTREGGDRAWRVAVGCAVALAPERRLHADARTGATSRTKAAFVVTFARDRQRRTTLELQRRERDGFTGRSGTGAHEFGATIGDAQSRAACSSTAMCSTCSVSARRWPSNGKTCSRMPRMPNMAKGVSPRRCPAR